MIIIGFDGLDFDYVELFGLKHIVLKEHGRTDISYSNKIISIPLWSSFLAGKLVTQDQNWDYQLKDSETFYKNWDNYKIIDVPATTHFKSELHRLERQSMKDYYEGRIPFYEFENKVWNIANKSKMELFRASRFKNVFVYFTLPDSLMHHKPVFGDKDEIEFIYKWCDLIAKRIKPDIIVSDHGMKNGSHTHNGYYAINKILNLEKPKFTDFYSIIRDWNEIKTQKIQENPEEKEKIKERLKKLGYM